MTRLAAFSSLFLLKAPLTPSDLDLSVEVIPIDGPSFPFDYASLGECDCQGNVRLVFFLHELTIPLSHRYASVFCFLASFFDRFFLRSDPLLRSGALVLLLSLSDPFLPGGLISHNYSGFFLLFLKLGKLLPFSFSPPRMIAARSAFYERSAVWLSPSLYPSFSD